MIKTMSDNTLLVNESQSKAKEILARWPEVSKLDSFHRRMFLEDFGSIWNKVWNKNLSFREIFAHKLFMRMFTTFDHTVPDRENQTILVIDGANGRLGIKIGRHYPLSQVLVAAPDDDSAAVIKILLNELGLSNTTVETQALPNTRLVNQSYDIVVVDLVAHPKIDYQVALKELVRLVKPSGQLIVFTSNRWNLIYRLYRFCAGRAFQFAYVQSFSRGQLSKLLRRQGLIEVKIRGFELGFNSYTDDSTPNWRANLGRLINKLVRIKDHLTNGYMTNHFGFGLLAVGSKPGDKNLEELRAMDEIVSQVKMPLPSDHDIKRVEIIILKYKDPEVEARCAKQILENTDWPYKLNLFDNRPGTKNMSKAWNKLIRESTCDYIIIMDSDIFVPKLTPCWLTRLMSTFMFDDCHVVLPKVTVTSCPEQKASKAENKPPEHITARFAGMCVLYKKEIFDKIGYFDEEFLLRGSDIEWVGRLLKSQYKAYIRPDVLVDHHGSYSTKKANKNAEYSRALERIYANTLYNEKVK